jgi:hypothetical protein
MFFTLKSSILVISGYLRTVQVAPGHPVMPCESLGKSLQTCLSQDKSGFPDELDAVALGMLGKAQATLVKQCKYIAAVPPNVGLPGDDCHSHDRCRKVWVDVWCKRVSCELLHPTSPLPISKVVGRVIDIDHGNGMSISCKNNVILTMTMSRTFQIEAQIIQAMIDKVITMYGLAEVSTFRASAFS